MESVAYQQLMGRIESIASHIEKQEATRSVQENPDTLLNTREAAEILHISTRTLQRLRSEKRIDFVILRGKYLYSAREVGRIIGKTTLLCPFWANRIAHFGHNIIAPCKVLVQGSILFYPFRYSGFS